MAVPIASKTRLQIRQAVGYELDNRAFIASTWSLSGTPTTAKDGVELSVGGADEYIGSQVQFNEVTGQGYGLKRWVTDSDISGVITFATISSASNISGAPASAEDYELWKPPFNIDNINQKIANAEMEVQGLIFMDKEDHTTYTQDLKYQYTFPSGFTHLDNVDYCYSIGREEQIDDCDTVWVTGIANVSTSVDTTIMKEGTGCAKLVIAAGAVTGKIAYHDFTAIDMTDKTEVGAWVYSTVALTGSELRIILDDTTGCGSAVETLAIPATSAYTWTRHVISLGNPVNDSAIVSVGLRMADDISAGTIYLDDIRGLDANSRVWKPLHRSFWGVVHGSTPYLMLTSNGLSVIGENKALRLTGYQQFTTMSGDTSTSQVDPDFITNRVLQQLTTGDKSRQYGAQAEKAKARNITNWRPGTIEI